MIIMSYKHSHEVTDDRSPLLLFHNVKSSVSSSTWNTPRSDSTWPLCSYSITGKSFHSNCNRPDSHDKCGGLFIQRLATLVTGAESSGGGRSKTQPQSPAGGNKCQLGRAGHRVLLRRLRLFITFPYYTR